MHNLTGGAFASTPPNAQRMSTWYRQLARASRSFAFVADLTVAMLGGGLKTKQKITGRLADALSELYMLAAVLKRYDDDGRPQGDHYIVELAAMNGLNRFQEAIGGNNRQLPRGADAPADARRRVPAWAAATSRRPTRSPTPSPSTSSNPAKRAIA